MLSHRGLLGGVGVGVVRIGGVGIESSTVELLIGVGGPYGGGSSVVNILLDDEVTSLAGMELRDDELELAVRLRECDLAPQTF